MGMQPPLETRAANETAEDIFSSLELSAFLTQDHTLYILGDKGTINLMATETEPAPTAKNIEERKISDLADWLRLRYNNFNTAATRLNDIPPAQAAAALSQIYLNETKPLDNGRRVFVVDEIFKAMRSHGSFEKLAKIMHQLAVNHPDFALPLFKHLLADNYACVVIAVQNLLSKEASELLGVFLKEENGMDRIVSLLSRCPKEIAEEILPQIGLLEAAGINESAPTAAARQSQIEPLISPADIQAFVKEALKNRRMSTGAIFKRVCEMGRGILIGDLLATGRFYSKIIGEVADSRTKPIVTMISLFEKTMAKEIIEERLATERLAALIGYIIGDSSGDITTRLEHFNDVTRSWSARNIGIALSAALAGQLWHQDQAIEHAVLNGRNRNEINEGMRLYYSLK
ncbi:MAG: hypothetical protein PHG97_01180 [Candidatus Margulisbacteria bacterium]|nr:hypothetical protein [Candidatus Margulisiibacteriota bacterium]